MNLKSFFLSVFITVAAIPGALADPGTNAVKQRQYVVCGTSSMYKPLAYKQDNIWQGFDADICRAIAAATLDDAQRFKIVSVKDSEIGKALKSNTIDVMLGHPHLSSVDEALQAIAPADTLYFDRLIFASRQPTEAKSMKDFSGAMVCVLRNSAASAILKEYNLQHALGFKLLELPDLQSFKEAFYLKRCNLAFENEILMTDMIASIKSGEPAQILPEQVSHLPVKAYTAADAPLLNTQVRWILNALRLAHAAGITSQNVDTFKATSSPSQKNLLGITFATWQKLGLEPEWLTNYIPQRGNYWQILERNLGSGSALKLDIKPDDLIENGGLFAARPFI